MSEMLRSIRPAPCGVDCRAARGVARFNCQITRLGMQWESPHSDPRLCVARRSWTVCSSKEASFGKDNPPESSEWKAVPDVWKSTAEKYGDKVALVDRYHDPPSKLTYKQLEQEIFNFSEGLRVIGISQDEKISLFADNSCRWLIADQGTMAAGAINVARGTRSSNEELLKLYEHSESVALIVDNPTFLNRLAETLCPMVHIRFVILLWGDKSNLSEHWLRTPIFCYNEVIDLGKESHAISFYSVERGDRVYDVINSDDLATLIYTSGTSSSPKGVMLTHRNLLFQIKNLGDFVPAAPGDRFLSILPPWHVYERAAEYFVLTCGVELVYTNVKNLMGDLKQYQPEYIFAVPLIYEMLYSALQKQISKRAPMRKIIAYLLINVSLLYMDAKRIYEGKALTSKKQQSVTLTIALDWFWSRAAATILWPLHALARIFFYQKLCSVIGISKACITAGGSLPYHIDRFFEVVGIKLQNAYGLTETSPAIAMRRSDLNVIGTVGHPLKQTEIKVVDSETGEVLPDGSKGIIKVRGPQVMKGYYKNPSAKCEALDDEGWFNTGDIGWIAPNNIIGRSRCCSGMLVLEGRAKDTIVLLTGENVEPSVLEEAALRSRLIKQILVFGQDQRRIGALIVPNKEELVMAAKGTLSSKPISSELSTNQVMEMIRKEVATWTSGCSFQIGPILILDEAFTIENDLMTPTMKVRREKVLARYKDQIIQAYKQKK